MPHLHDVAEAQQTRPEQTSFVAAYVERKHEQPSLLDAHSSGKQLHDRPGPGQPAGAQQTVRASTASAQMNDVGGLASEQEHARPSPMGAGSHRVIGGLGVGAHEPEHSVPTHVARSRASALDMSPSSAAQRASRVVVQPSRFASTPSRPEAHARSTTSWQRSFTQLPQVESSAAKRQCSPPASAETNKIHPPPRVAKQPTTTLRATDDE
ncbi:MAG: hypothetical protein NVS3B10_28850 [Polyangiales bacterium]